MFLGLEKANQISKKENRGRDAYYFTLASHLVSFDQKWSSYVICDCNGVNFYANDDSFRLYGEPYYYFWIGNFELFYQETIMKLARKRNLVSASTKLDTIVYVLDQLPEAEKVAFYAEAIAILEKASVDEGATYLEDYSIQRNQLNPLLEGINPNVWNAGRAVLRWSAFFRYVRKNYPIAWETFILSISDVKPKPEVRTPSVMQRKR